MYDFFLFYCIEEVGLWCFKGEGLNLYLFVIMLLRWVNSKNKLIIRFMMILGYKEKKNFLYFILNFWIFFISRVFFVKEIFKVVG